MAASSNRALITQSFVLRHDHATIVAINQAYARLKEKRRQYDEKQYRAAQRFYRRGEIGLPH